MLRINMMFLVLSLVCGKVFANIGVELDVVFRDSTVQCRYLYVLRPNTDRTNDTLAVFDTLSFSGQSRTSLFYSVSSKGKDMLSLVDSSGICIESKPFSVSPLHTVFTVVVGQRQILVTGKDYLYPQRNEDERSYFIFLFLFFSVKILITAIFNFVSKLHKRNISIAAGAFLLSAFAEWFLPLHYLYRFLITMLSEYMLIALVGRKSISRLRAAMLVLVVNFCGYGIIAILFLLFVFW